MIQVRAGIVWLFVVAACGSQPGGGAHGARLAIAPGQSLGWIGVAPRAARAGDWLPVGTQAALAPVGTSDPGLPAGIPLSAIGITGGVVTVVSGARTKVPYGCERNQLDAIVFTGGKLPPGPVWLLPRGAPSTWQPAALEIESPGAAATQTHRVDRVGPLTLELTRSDPGHGNLAIKRGDHTLLALPIERAAVAGADLGPIDLRQPGVAIPQPVAAWSLVDGGPILLVLVIPSYEGQRIVSVLVEDDAARALPELERYLYQCAV